MNLLLQVKTSCRPTAGSREPLVAVRRSAHAVEVSNQDGVSLSCDPSLELCSLTLDGWLHGRENTEFSTEYS